MILDTTVLIDLRRELRSACEAFLAAFKVLWPNGAPIADHDLWIAALALEHVHPVVSRNERHPVPRLSVRSY